MCALVFVMLFAALKRASAKQTQEAIHHMAGTVLSMLYLGGLGWFLMAIRVKHSVRPNGEVRFEGSTGVITCSASRLAMASVVLSDLMVA